MINMIKWKPVASALALAFCVCSAANARPANSADSQPFLFGAEPGKGGGSVEAFETLIDHTIAIVNRYQTFSSFPRHVVSDDIGAGRIPMISWTSNDGHGGQVRALDILAGKYDTQLVAQAKAYATLGGTVFIRWQPEMTDNARNADFFTDVSPNQWGPTYASVWRHLHRIFLDKGASNVQWVWAPGGDAFIIRHGLFKCGTYFPGAKYVDWMGFDTYNKSDTPEAYDANPEFQAFYAIAPLLAPGKPLMNAQTGATSKTDAQREWIATAQTSLKTEYPLVRGWLWYNIDCAGSKGSSRQYALTGAGLDAFKAMAADPYFQ